MLSHTPASSGKIPVIRAMLLAIRLSFNPQRSRVERSSPLNRRPKTKSFHPLGSKSSMPFLESRTKEWLKTFVGLERTILSTRSSPFLPVSTIGGFPCAVSNYVYLNPNYSGLYYEVLVLCFCDGFGRRFIICPINKYRQNSY